MISSTDRRPSTVAERFFQPFRAFTKHRLAGSLLLVAATVAALVVANSPWAEAYHHLLATELTVGTDSFGVTKSVHHWINDGLMGVFFFVIGLEIKREVLVGHLSGLRKAALPIFAAVGGMVAPALLYLAFNLGGQGQTGWGIPMATDIAFCLGVLTLLGDRVSSSARVFLTALAIVDDIGAILVIAFFYTDQLSLFALGAGGLIIVLSAAANAAGLRNSVVYFIFGTLAWLAFVKSGVHATLAAVLMAFTIPARTRIDRSVFLTNVESILATFRETLRDEEPPLLSSEQQRLLNALEAVSDEAISPLQRLEDTLFPLMTFVVLPTFALANAGVSLEGGLTTLAHPVALGIIVGLVVGKQAGVLLFSWVSVKTGLADLPKNTGWTHIWGIGVLAGIGFTMSLFINGLAFKDPALQATGKTAILLASTISAVAGYILIRIASSRSDSEADSEH